MQILELLRTEQNPHLELAMLDTQFTRKLVKTVYLAY